ncbi:NADPH-dependent FMN reductase [Streptomyces sp. TLI_146]|uniref:NADPH-dependent FMN reductase n=1 Tax=Streptomyces sp. TLI_146 TaxID=1938858 RepID=UPI000C704227|nr:NAD(P)H-dependent oxidoreductase [Streptomyces sp. TLI_146]PKV85602.1 NAD(P)H-dependent FMN reductase [Streptomyces sp. TLI_146]
MDITTAPVAEPTAASTAPLRLAVIIGSNREGRFGPVVGKWVLDRLGERDDFEVDVIDLADIALPTSISYDPAPPVKAVLDTLTPRLAGADAFLVLTPEYNHSFPASIKNLIDWHYVEWQAKPVGLVSYGGISGGLRAVEHLRQIFAELHAVTVRDTVSFHQARGLFESDGELREPTEPEAAVKRLLDQLGWWGRTLRDAKATRPYAA